MPGFPFPNGMSLPALPLGGKGVPAIPATSAIPCSVLFVGLDLGSLTDYTAASIVERTPILGPDGVPLRTSRSVLLYHFEVLALHRFELGTSYTSMVTDVASRLRRPALVGAKLAIDATGVGRPIVDLFRDLRVDLAAVTITGGQSYSHPSYDEWHVAKIELVAAGRAALESKHVGIAKGVAHRDTLKRELLDFKVKTTKAQNETYAAREGEHDDLCLCVLIPIWISWMLGQTGAFITGHHSVGPMPRRDPHRISADATKLYGPRRTPALPGGSIRIIKDRKEWDK